MQCRFIDFSFALQGYYYRVSWFSRSITTVRWKRVIKNIYFRKKKDIIKIIINIAI